MKIITLCTIVVALSACATKPDDQFAKCMDAVATNPKYAPLEKKLALGKVSSQTLEMRANNSVASDSDKPLISSWASDRQQCFSAVDPVIQKSMHPKVYALILQTRANAKTLTSRLYEGKITYGQYAEGRQLNEDADQQARLEIAGKAVDEQSANERQVLLMQLQALQNKPTPTPAPMPYMIPTRPTVTTNCTTIAGQVNCTTR